MTVGVLLWRKGFIKIAGSVIDASLERGHETVIFWDPEERKPGEAVTEADLAPWPGARRVPHRRGQPLAPLLAAHGVRALVAPSLYMILCGSGHIRELDAMRAAGVRLFSLDYAFETVTSEPEGYRVIDTTFYVSEYQRALHWRLMAAGFASLGADTRTARSAVCGCTMTDQLAHVDRGAVRKRYGLDGDRPVVLLMSLKMTVDPWRELAWGTPSRGLGLLRHAPARRAFRRGLPIWWRAAFGGNAYRRLVEAARRFADRHGAALVVKTRAKNEDPAFLRGLADAMVEDEGMYPYTSIELMAIAGLCLHFQSGAVLEAAFAHVPSLSIVVPQRHLLEFTSEGTLAEVYGQQLGSLQHFPGIVASGDLASATRSLDAGTLADFRVDPEARRRYVEKFLGFDDTDASRRVVAQIERVVG